MTAFEKQPILMSQSGPGLGKSGFVTLRTNFEEQAICLPLVCILPLCDAVYHVTT